MKRLVSLIMSFVIVMVMSGVVFAQEFNAQGSALVPNLMYIYNSQDSWSLPYIVLTNITNETVTCQLRVYDADGVGITNRGSFLTGSIGGWSAVAAGGDVEIPAHSSRMYAMGYGNNRLYTIGHAEIKWSSTDTKAKVALIGGVTIHKRDTYRYNVGFLINQGNPF